MLRLKGNSYNEIAAMFGVSTATVQGHLKPLLPILEHPEALQGFQSNRADVYDGIQLQLAGNLLDKDKVRKATLGNVAYAMRQLNDMARLDRDQSTVNVAVAHIDAIQSIDAVEAEIAAITESSPTIHNPDQLPAIYNDAGLAALEEQIQAVQAAEVIQADDIIEDTTD